MKIALVATGGTIASRASPDGVVADVNGAGLMAALDPDRRPPEVDVHDVGVRGSYALTIDDMCEIVMRVEECCAEGVEGVVVTHGTDSLEETAFLADLVHAGDVPVVFTGAQRPFDAPDRDGLDNLAAAFEVAAARLSRGRGVLVAFGGQVLSARGVRKVHTSELRAFDNLALPQPAGSPRSTMTGAAALPATTSMPQVDVVATVPGGSGAAIRDAVRRHPSGLVLQAVGVGNVSASDADAVGEAITAGIPVLVTTRVAHGSVQPIYGAGGGKALERAGAIFAGDLSTWQARVLLATSLAVAPDGRAEQIIRTWLARFAIG